MLEFEYAIAPFSLPAQNAIRFEGVVDDISHRLLSIGLYLYKYGHTAIAFGDIKVYVEFLDKKDQILFMSIIHQFLDHSIKPLDILGENRGWRDECFSPNNTPDVSFIPYSLACGTV